MPYISKERRRRVDLEIDALLDEIEAYIPKDDRDGTLNYIITRLIKALYEPSYKQYNAAIGVLECTKLELYRRIIAQYEDIKIKENGDV